MRSFLPALLLALPAATPAAPPVAAVVETTLATDAGQIRQFAFDGDPNTFFASKAYAGTADHFTLVFDAPVALKSVTATTGRPDGADQLDTGALEVSADGKAFEPLAQFAGGVTRAAPNGRQVRAIRLKPAADLKHPLVVREIA